MCGIVGVFRHEGSVLDALVEGLRVLEYRGYDSVGIGAIQDGEIVVRRKAGRIEELEGILADGGLDDVSVGIGHSRWATHGPPTDENAHPHSDASGDLIVVHNGIIENYQELREELGAQGVVFRSQTDTEILAHLISRSLGESGNLVEAVRAALARVKGYYAIAVLARTPEPRMVCAREGPPLCVASTDDGAFLASDVLAILPHTRRIAFLQDGDVAELEPGRVVVYGRDGAVVERQATEIEWEAEASDKGGFPHFMLKEIHEQPDVVARCMFGRLDEEAGDVHLDGALFADESLQALARVQVLACGTALHAGLVGRYQLEGLAGIPVDVDFASEFRYREPVVIPDTLALGISQSGETADTLAALRVARELGCAQAAICNSIGSSMVRESDASILIEAGPEIGVASTKAFVAMVTASYLLALRMGRARGRLGAEDVREHIAQLRQLRPSLEHLLARESVERLRGVAERYASSKGFLFLGRGINFPIALEGALKLKEISYMHAEGYAAGEMKHGPIAMIEPDMTTVVVVNRDHVAEKVRYNIEQVRARSGPVICVGSEPRCLELADVAFEVPDIGPWLSPILNSVPLQLFAYYVALARGCDIDKPRNLAKSVTVE